MSEKKMNKWIEETKERLGKRYFDDALYSNAYFMKERLRKDNDCCVVIDGFTGAGKSTLNHQLCSAIDPTYPGKDHLRICDNPKKLLKALETAQPGQAINVDEASVSGLSSKTSGSKTGISIQAILEICRAKNLFLCFCLPSFFQLNKYIREDRTDCLIHVCSRGHYGFYDKHKTKQLSIKACKFHNYTAEKPNFFGWFVKDVPEQVNMELYKKQKMENINEIIAEARTKIDQQDAEKSSFYVGLRSSAKEIGISRDMLMKEVQEGRIMGRKIGSKWFIAREEYEKLVPNSNKKDKSPITTALRGQTHSA